MATEAIGSFRTVYSFAQEGSEHQRYAGAIDVYYELNVKQSLMQAGYYMVCSTFLCAPWPALPAKMERPFALVSG